LPVLTGKYGDAFQYCLRHMLTIWKTLRFMVKSNVCSTCDVLPGELGSNANSHHARHYSRYDYCKCEAASNDPPTMFETLSIDFKKQLFHKLHLVSAPGLHKPDLLYTVYLGVFMHLMD